MAVPCKPPAIKDLRTVERARLSLRARGCRGRAAQVRGQRSRDDAAK